MHHDESARHRLRLLAGGPFARWLDASVIRAGAEGVELHLPYRDELGGADGSTQIHRGVVAAFAELAGALVNTPAQAGVRARSLVLDYIADAPAGSALYARARSLGGNVRIEIRASDSQVLVARATLAGVGLAPDTGPTEPPAQPIYPN
jgi:acyl-coenzyme A thioesterase PaaI-like protein